MLYAAAIDAAVAFAIYAAATISRCHAHIYYLLLRQDDMLPRLCHEVLTCAPALRRWLEIYFVFAIAIVTP